MADLCTSMFGSDSWAERPLMTEVKRVTSRSRELVEDVERLVLANLPRRMGDTVLAKSVGANVADLHRAFLDVRSTTMYQAIYKLRLETVKRILESDPSRSPEAVACECGFGHYGVFHRRYRRYLETREQEAATSADTDCLPAEAVRASA